MSTTPVDAFRWTTHTYGDISNLKKEAIKVEPPSDGQVLVSVRAIGLNFADVFGTLGLYSPAGDPPLTPGFEVSGTIRAIGPNVPAELSVGDRVLGVTLFGGYTTALCLDWRYVRVLPEGWSFEEGAAWPVQALTAWYSLCVLGDISKIRTRLLTSPKKRVLVHSAAGGVGLILTRLVHGLGGEVIATVGSASKVSVLQERGVAPEHIIVRGVDDKAKGFEQTVRERLGGENEGVDVIIDSILGSYFHPGWRLLNRGGRYITIGSASLMPSTGLTLSNIPSLLKLAWDYFRRPKLDLVASISDNKSLAGFNLALMFDCIDLLRGGFEEILDISTEPQLVSKTYAFDDALTALRDFQTGRSVGKLVLVVRDESD